jgi:hypothetical protein
MQCNIYDSEDIGPQQEREANLVAAAGCAQSAPIFPVSNLPAQRKRKADKPIM